MDDGWQRLVGGFDEEDSSSDGLCDVDALILGGGVDEGLDVGVAASSGDRSAR